MDISLHWTTVAVPLAIYVIPNMVCNVRVINDYTDINCIFVKGNLDI